MALDAFRQTTARRKPDDSVITDTDHAVEDRLRTRIAERFPDDGIMGEERDSQPASGSAWWWILDPIDGTASFAMGLPAWTVCIGLWHGDDPAAGVLWTPFLREEHHGGDGFVRWDGRSVEREPVCPDDWDRQTLLCIPSRTHLLYDVTFPGKCRNLGSTAYHMGAVIDGRAVGALLGRIHLWDVAAGLGIGRSMGLRLRRLDGTEPDWEHLREEGTARRTLVFGFPVALQALSNQISPRRDESD